MIPGDRETGFFGGSRRALPWKLFLLALLDECIGTSFTRVLGRTRTNDEREMRTKGCSMYLRESTVTGCGTAQLIT